MIIMRKNLTYILALAFMWLPIAVLARTNVDELSQLTNASELPRVSPYFFQHQYLSVVAPMIAEKDGEILSAPYILNTVSPEGNGFRSPFSDDEISVDAFDVEGRRIYVWSFPESKYLREALYMAFVPVDGFYKAFAVCIGSMVDWEVSVSTENSRATFGRIKKPASAKECLDLLIDRGVLTGNIVPGEFLQDGYKAPSYRE